MAAPHPGKWSPVFNTPQQGEQPFIVSDTEQIAAHACLVCTNLQNQEWKILFHFAFPREGQNNLVQSRIWDPVTNTISAQDIPDWPDAQDPTIPPRLFCCGHLQMADGKIMMAGGIKMSDDPPPTDVPHYPTAGNRGINYTYIFDPNPPVSGEEWKVAGDGISDTPFAMADDRFYPTLTQLGVTPQGFNGKIVVMSGWIEDNHPPGSWTMARNPQYYDENTGWNYFPFSGALQPFNGHFEYYPSAHLIPAGPNAGKIFYCLPMKQAYVFNPFWNGIPNGGYWQGVGGARSEYRLNGTSTMLPLLPPYTSAKVLLIDGSTSETTYDSLAIRSADVIDIASGNPQWTHLNNFSFFARKNHLTVILPDDTLMAIGGNLGSTQLNQGFGANPEFSTELIDSRDSQVSNWKSIMHPGHVYPREHHTTALLLPDGRVWLAGSGGGVIADVVTHAEIYEPRYLFEGERPQILSSPPEISYPRTFGIETSHQISAIRLIRLGSVTHSTDMSQLSVGLSFQAGPSNGSFTYTVSPPPNANIAPPGIYMLFVLRHKNQSLSGETMIPSVAKIVKLS